MAGPALPVLGRLRRAAGEEVGWRGFALPVLLERCGWVGAGVVLGLTWTSLAWAEPLAPNGPLGLLLTAIALPAILTALATAAVVTSATYPRSQGPPAERTSP